MVRFIILSLFIHTLKRRKIYFLPYSFKTKLFDCFEKFSHHLKVWKITVRFNANIVLHIYVYIGSDWSGLYASGFIIPFFLCLLKLVKDHVFEFLWIATVPIIVTLSSYPETHILLDRKRIEVFKCIQIHYIQDLAMSIAFLLQCCCDSQPLLWLTCLTPDKRQLKRKICLLKHSVEKDTLI